MNPSCHKCLYFDECDDSQYNHSCENYELDPTYTPDIEEYDDFIEESEFEEDEFENEGSDEDKEIE